MEEEAFEGGGGRGEAQEEQEHERARGEDLREEEGGL